MWWMVGQIVLDWQDSVDLPPPMKYELCTGIISRVDWQTNCLVPRLVHILRHWVFSEVDDLDCGHSAIVLERVLAYSFVGLVRAKTTLFLVFVSFGPPSKVRIWTIQDLVPVHHQRNLFLFFSSSPLNGLDCQAYSVPSHVHKHDLSSLMKPCSPVTSSAAHQPTSSLALFSTIKVLFMLLTFPLTRSDGFSIEFLVCRTIVLAPSKVQVVISIPNRERNL